MSIATVVYGSTDERDRRTIKINPDTPGSTIVDVISDELGIVIEIYPWHPGHIVDRPVVSNTANGFTLTLQPARARNDEDSNKGARR